jgi:hypothetical protein
MNCWTMASLRRNGPLGSVGYEGMIARARIAGRMGKPMTAVVRVTWHLALAAIGAATLVAALHAPASAQQSDPSVRTAKSTQGAATRPAPKPAKPVARAGAAQNAKANAKTPEAQGRPWTLQDALPDRSASMRQYDPPPSPGIGRVPLQSGPGTLGFETKTQVNPNQTPDGATIRGQDATAARSSSYVGMSLSVPTSDKR